MTKTTLKKGVDSCGAPCAIATRTVETDSISQSGLGQKGTCLFTELTAFFKKCIFFPIYCKLKLVGKKKRVAKKQEKKDALIVDTTRINPMYSSSLMLHPSVVSDIFTAFC